MNGSTPSPWLAPSASPAEDRYEPLFPLAAGGMAEVWVARQRGGGGFERPVALKRMLPHLRHDENFLSMFLDEGRVAGWLTHPNIVSTLDVGLDAEGTPFLVMELVQGLSLSQLLRASPEALPLEVAVEILAQAAEGLDFAHHACSPAGRPLEIVHRDVSPQNVLVGIDGRARIGDFGVARALERLTTTVTGEVKGKIAYFSPEQAAARPIDARSDVFALGVVAWETLAGRRLFQGGSPVVSLQLVRELAVPRVDAERPELPAAIADVVAHALVRDVEARLPSAAAFAEQLRDALRGSGGSPASSRTIVATVKARGGAKLEELAVRVSREFDRRPSLMTPTPAPVAVAIDVELEPEADGATVTEPARPGLEQTPSPLVTETPPSRTGSGLSWRSILLVTGGAIVLALGAGWMVGSMVGQPSDELPSPPVAGERPDPPVDTAGADERPSDAPTGGEMASGAVELEPTTPPTTEEAAPEADPSATSEAEAPRPAPVGRARRGSTRSSRSSTRTTPAPATEPARAPEPATTPSEPPRRRGPLIQWGASGG